MAAQSVAEDSLLYQRAVSHLVDLYHRASADQSGLFNGRQYAQYAFRFEDGAHPFFFSDKPGMGQVVYDGILYRELALQYDEIQGVLVMQDDQHFIQLLTPRIKSFSLFNSHFIRIVQDSTMPAQLKTGFYNVLYSGQASLLRKEEKKIRADVSGGELQRYIDVSVSYFVYAGNTYHLIKNKKTLLDVLADRKKELRQYIRSNGLNFRKDRQQALEKVIACYNQLVK